MYCALWGEPYIAGLVCVDCQGACMYHSSDGLIAKR